MKRKNAMNILAFVRATPVRPGNRPHPPGRRWRGVCAAVLLGLPLMARAADYTDTADGYQSLNSVTTGTLNTAYGCDTLALVTTGGKNTAVGVNALLACQGDSNTALGLDALSSNVYGAYNVAAGAQALAYGGSGNYMTAVGYEALYNNTADGSTALGFDSLYNNTTGSDNTALGFESLYSNTTGTCNTAVGYACLGNVSTGGGNTALGGSALAGVTNGGNNTAVGYGALQQCGTGNGNIALGQAAGASLTKGSNDIDIGNAGVAGENGFVRIGTVGTQTNVFVAGITGVTVANGLPVVVAPNGHLGTKTSSARFKEAIRPMAQASEAILGLQPVSFRYKPEYDPEGMPQFGLIAEEVDKVDPALVVRDAEGKPLTVRYEEVNAMLLNEFLKEHRQVQAQQDTIAQLRAGLETQQKQLQDLAALVHARMTPPADAAPRP